MTNKELFNRWMEMKDRIQILAGVVQNDGMNFTEDELLQWIHVFDDFKDDLNKVYLQTVRKVTLK